MTEQASIVTTHSKRVGFNVFSQTYVSPEHDVGQGGGGGLKKKNWREGGRGGEEREK